MGLCAVRSLESCLSYPAWAALQGKTQLSWFMSMPHMVGEAGTRWGMEGCIEVLTHKFDLLGPVGFLAFMSSISWTDDYISF